MIGGGVPGTHVALRLPLTVIPGPDLTGVTYPKPRTRRKARPRPGLAGVCVRRGKNLPRRTWRTTENARRFIATICRANAARFARTPTRVRVSLLRAFSVVLRVLRGKSLTVIKTDPKYAISPHSYPSCFIGTYRDRSRWAVSRRTGVVHVVGPRQNIRSATHHAYSFRSQFLGGNGHEPNDPPRPIQ